MSWFKEAGPGNRQRELVIDWAQGQLRGRQKAGALVAEGTTIYSYGEHFPIATISQDENGLPVAYVTTDSRSVTTTGHVNLVKRILETQGMKIIMSDQYGGGIVSAPSEGFEQPKPKIKKEREVHKAPETRQYSEDEIQKQVQDLGNAKPPSGKIAPDPQYRHLDVEDAPQSTSDVPGMDSKHRQRALDRLIEQWDQASPEDKPMLESKIRELQAALKAYNSGWLKMAEATLCDACSSSTHDPERDWEACTWGECECSCQSDTGTSDRDPSTGGPGAAGPWDTGL